MQQSILLYFLSWRSLLLGCILILGACAINNKNPQSSSSDSLDLEKQIKNATNNQERLYKLMQGTFFRHVYDSNDSLILWRSKTGEDSVLTYIQAIGEPSKDGYLLMFASYLTKLPDEPFTSFIIKIDQISRDTLATFTYNPPYSYTLEEIMNKKIEADINLKDYTCESGTPYYTFIKGNNARFNFTVPYQEYPYGGENPNKQFSESYGFIALSGHKTTWQFYTKTKEKKEKIANYDIRRYNINLKELCNLKE